MATVKVKLDFPIYGDLQKFTANTARNALALEQTRGFPKEQFLTVVDNRVKDSVAAVDNVLPFGKIVFQAQQNIAEIALETLDLLIANSPRGFGSEADRTGRYYEHHRVMVNGVIVEGINSVRAALNTTGGNQIQIVNVQPYARKIERGHSEQTPKGVYKRVYSIIKRKWGNVAFISQRYIPASKIPGVLDSTVTQREHVKGNTPRQVTQVYPSIRIRTGRGG